MKRRFKSYTITQFEQLVNELVVTRPINHVQTHHTAVPRIQDYKGEDTIWAMWNYHVNTRGFRDIAQHFTVAPNGTIWDGRALDVVPACIAGHNFGGICIEVIGNFNNGMDVLDGSQLYSVTKMNALLLDRFQLPLDNRTVVFHREKTATDCPGSSINKDSFMRLVKIAMEEKSVLKPNWMFDGVNYLHEKGWLSDKERWTKAIQNDEKIPVWTALNIIARAYRDIDTRIGKIEESLSKPILRKEEVK